MPTRTINTSIKLDGEQEFKKQMASVNSSLRTTKSEMQLLESEFKGQANTIEALTAKDKLLRQEQEQQAEKVRALEQAVKDATEAYGEGDTRVDAYQQQLNRAKARLNDLGGEIQKNGKYMDEAAQSTDGCASSIDEFGREVQEAEKETDTFGEVLKANLTSEAIIAGLKAMVNAVKEVAGAFKDTVVAAAEYGDNVDKMSQKMGMSTDAYQEWDFIMQHCGTSIDGLQSGMKTLATAAETGSDAFTALGISQADIANMSQEELFSATLSALQNVSDETQRTYLAGKLLGRGATELGPLLNMSAEETEAMRQQVHDLGGVMSEDAVKAGAAFQDSLTNLQTALNGAKNQIGGEFLPSITTAMDGLTMILSGNVEEGIALVEQGIEEFGQTLEELGPYAEQALYLLMDTISACLPQIMEAGGNVLISLIDGLLTAMPELVPVVIDLVLTLVNTLLSPQNVETLINAAIQLAVGIGTGLIRAIPQIAAKVPQIISSIVRGLIGAIPQLASAGMDLIRGLWSGITSMGSWLWNQVTSFVDNYVVGPVKRFLGINSPSRKFRMEVGRQIPPGISGGVEDAMPQAARDIEAAMPDWSTLVPDPPDPRDWRWPTPTPVPDSGTRGGGKVVTYGDIHLTVTVDGADYDEEKLAEFCAYKLREMLDGKEA